MHLIFLFFFKVHGVLCLTFNSAQPSKDYVKTRHLLRTCFFPYSCMHICQVGSIADSKGPALNYWNSWVCNTKNPPKDLLEASIWLLNFFSLPSSGYLAPEYVLGGQLTMKADVYSYGVLILETVSGKSSSSSIWLGDKKSLLEWVGQIFFKFLNFFLVLHSFPGVASRMCVA